MFKKFISVLICLIITVSCESENLLQDYSETETNQALYFDAKEKINKFDWDGAIEILTVKISAEYAQRLDVKESLMHAYGGKCGISFFDFINNLKNTSSTKMFDFAMKIFTGRVVDMVACDQSLAVLHSIGETAATRTNSQNLFAAILGLTRMATTVKAKFDTEFSGLGDGNVDVGANSCPSSNAALRLSDDEMNRIVAGVGLVFENLAALGDSLTEGSAGGAFEAAKTICQTELAIPTLQQPQFYDPSLVGVTWATLLSRPPGYTPTWVDFGLPADFAEPLNCLNTKDAQVTAKMRRIFRRMIASTEMGFGNCAIGDMTFGFNMNTRTATVSAACCPPPILVAP